MKLYGNSDSRLKWMSRIQILLSLAGTRKVVSFYKLDNKRM